MSKREELELDISVCMCVRCTIDTKDKSPRYILSSEFQFEGGRWKLHYFYHPLCAGRHCLYLQKCSGVAPSPLHVSVQVKSSGTDRIVPVLSQETRFTDELSGTGAFQTIWNRFEDQILRSVPEFRPEDVLKLIVFLKLEDSGSSLSESTGQSSSSSTTSISDQTTLLPNGTLCLESLSADLEQLLMQGYHDDVEFLCEGQSTKAHKSIVCSRSPVIASMLGSDMVEGRTGVVTIPDMEPDIFRQFMRYLYSGQLGELTFDTALRLYEAGDQYAVRGLARRCREFLMEHLSLDNACEVLVVADAHSDKDFVEMVVEYMVENRLPLVSEGWSAFCEEHCKLAIKVLNPALKASQK